MVSANALAMTGYLRLMALVVLVGQILNLVLSILVVQSLGLMGIALATVVASTLTGVVILVQVGHLYGLGMRRLLENTLLPSLPSTRSLDEPRS